MNQKEAEEKDKEKSCQKLIIVGFLYEPVLLFLRLTGAEVKCMDLFY